MHCHICEEETEKIKDIAFDHRYAYCCKCEYIRIYSEDRVTQEEEKALYDYHENSIEQEGYVNFFKKFIDQGVMPFIKGGKGLDFGSGPEPVLAQVMARDYQQQIDCYDLYYQPEKLYEGKLYDYIISTEVMEHLYHPMEVMEEMHKHLKVGGILALMTLFHGCDREKFLTWWYRRDETHISFFTPKTFQVMGEKLGFKVIYTDHQRYITLEKQ